MNNSDPTPLMKAGFSHDPDMNSRHVIEFFVCSATTHLGSSSDGNRNLDVIEFDVVSAPINWLRSKHRCHRQQQHNVDQSDGYPSRFPFAG